MAAQTQTREDVASPDIEVASASQVPGKVELDLDDAPFLQPEEPPAPAPEEHETPEEPAQDGKKRRKKLIIIGGAALAAILAGVAAAWWFFFRGSPPPVVPEAPGPEVVVVPSTPTPLGPHDIVHEFAVFVVPVNDDRTQTRFLICKFAAISRDQAVDQEMTQQQLSLRDAVYFYLRGKDALWLQDAHNYDTIKKDLMSIFNDYLSQGKLEDIVFESYLSH